MLSIPDVKNIVLGLIGGSPQLKTASVFAEKLKIIKSIEGGNLAPLLSLVKAGGIASILQNPVGAAIGALNGQIGSVTAALSAAAGIPGIGGLASAVSGLSGAVSSVQSFTNALSGITSGDIGPLSLVAASNVSSMIGQSLPAAITAPLQMTSQLNGMASTLSSVTNGVISGTVAVTDAIATVNGMASTLTGAVSDAAAAHDDLMGAASAVSSVSAMAAIVSGAGGDALQGVFQSMIQPQHLATMKAATDEMIAT